MTLAFSQPCPQLPRLLSYPWQATRILRIRMRPSHSLPMQHGVRPSGTPACTTQVGALLKCPSRFPCQELEVSFSKMPCHPCHVSKMPAVIPVNGQPILLTFEQAWTFTATVIDSRPSQSQALHAFLGPSHPITPFSHSNCHTGSWLRSPEACITSSALFMSRGWACKGRLMAKCKCLMLAADFASSMPPSPPPPLPNPLLQPTPSATG